MLYTEVQPQLFICVRPERINESVCTHPGLAKEMCNQPVVSVLSGFEKPLIDGMSSTATGMKSFRFYPTIGARNYKVKRGSNNHFLHFFTSLFPQIRFGQREGGIAT